MISLSPVLTLLILLAGYSAGTESTRQNVMDKVAVKIENEQMKETRKALNFMKPSTMEGMYNSYVRFNFRGKCEQSLLRRKIKFLSMMSSVSGLIGTELLDAFLLGGAPKPSDIQIERIVKMYSALHDRNKPYNTSEVAYFVQKYNNNTHRWFNGPDMALPPLESFGIEPGLWPKLVYGSAGETKFPADLDHVFDPVHMAERLRPAMDADTFDIHVGFGARLYKARDQFPKAWQQWHTDNTNLTSIWNDFKKYAYRPFSSDPEESLVDPKSYYFMREYLDKAKAEGRDLALMTTYAQDLAGERAVQGQQDLIPLAVNTVCLGGIAKFLYSFTATMTTGLEKPEVLINDDDFTLYINSNCDYLAYFLRNDMNGRSDLGLTYYTSLYDFYWHTARALMYMENGKSSGEPLPLPALEECYINLSSVMRQEVTERILKQRTAGDDGQYYFDDILGNADMSYYDEPIRRHEDRIFSTAMAANALLFSWSVQDDAGVLSWLEATPQMVKDAVQGCAKWLEMYTLSGEYDLSGAWGCSNLKSHDNFPYWYPANRFEYLNGTKIEGFTYIPAEITVFAMQGYVDPDTYQKMLEVDQFGVPTPLTFNGYNNDTGVLVFYSSDAVTYAGVLTTLSMAQSIQH